MGLQRVRHEWVTFTSYLTYININKAYWELNFMPDNLPSYWLMPQDPEVATITIILLAMKIVTFEKASKFLKVSKLMMTEIRKLRKTGCQNLGFYCSTILPAKISILFSLTLFLKPKSWELLEQCNLETLTYVCVPSHIQLFVTPWSVSFQVPTSMEFLREEYWSGLPFLPPGPHPNRPRDQMLIPLVSWIAGWFFTIVPLGTP